MNGASRIDPAQLIARTLHVSSEHSGGDVRAGWGLPIKFCTASRFCYTLRILSLLTCMADVRRTFKVRRTSARGEDCMDPVTAAIIAAATAGAAAGLTDTAKVAITDSYNGLKGLLQRKFGEQSEVVKAVAHVETDRDYQPVLEGKVKKSGADQDAEVLAAAQALLEKVSATPSGRQLIQTITGDQNIVISGSGNVVNYGLAADAQKKTK